MALPEQEEANVRDYVNNESPADDQVTLVQKVGSRRVLERMHEIYDVHCQKSRWWVISNPTNLYSQDDFPLMEIAFTYHLGLSAIFADRSRAERGTDQETKVHGAYRRFAQAVEAMDSATEAAHFQSVGIMCREALIALTQELMGQDWVGLVEAPPKRSDFKGWATILAERLSEGRLRAYVKGLCETTWDLAVWLQHYTDADPQDAEFVLDATGHLIGCFASLLRMKNEGQPEQCPRCGSYGLDDGVEVVGTETPTGVMEWMSCRACDWRSEKTFSRWPGNAD